MAPLTKDTPGALNLIFYQFETSCLQLSFDVINEVHRREFGEISRTAHRLA